ncbi:MAG: hypothetical protein ACRDRP_13975 [Pseudonocardiaceae bacterium]
MPETPELDQRVHDHREALIGLMAAAGRCDDISSGLIVDTDDILVDP